MTDWRMPITKAALSLRRNALAGGALAVLILAIAPPTAGAHGFTALLGWWLLLAFCLAPLALSAHLLFDAALFRLAASHDAEAAGLSAIDDVLERMGLRQRDGRPAPLAVRLAGCRRLIWMQRILLAVALALFAILLLDGLEGGGA
ncbi:hypothetical protein GR158_07525 [Shinella sp. AETb1-6]|uniref:hypothetical protein n=1 Tax=Shinella sp. AETb1-6 TaxID=2692210 RepID=UPI001368366C|nr:hypothetical protein [Shinella sp. AETb1-6]MXN50964.1 hypothetical protein [Shinella sp. AETb1-6]